MVLTLAETNTTDLPATLAAARVAVAANPLGAEIPGTALVVASGSHYAELMARTKLGYTDQNGARRLWTVSKTPLYGPKGEEWPGAFGTRRDDTGEALGVVGARYEPLQSSQVAEAFDLTFAHIPPQWRPKLQNAGTLGSAKVFAQLAMAPELSALLRVPADRDSPTGAFLTLTNTHDGTSTAVLGATCVRIVCKNTWKMAHKQARKNGGFVLKHNPTTVKDYQKNATEWIKATAKGFAEQGERMRAYASKPLTSTVIYRAVDEILFGEVPNTKTRQQQANADAIIEMIEARDGQFVPTGDVTAYSLFNAVTAYTMHRRPARGSLAEQSETRLWRVLTDDEITPRAFAVIDAL